MANKKKQAQKIAAEKAAKESGIVVAENNGKVKKKTYQQPVKKDKNGKPKKTAKEFFEGIGKGIKAIISELKKVTWPKIPDTFKNTGIVLGVCVIFLAVCLGIDLGLSAIFDKIVG